MNGSRSADPGALERAILDYIEANPHAADSAAGVARWWLGRLGVDATLRNVEEALEHLVSCGLVRRVRLPDGSTLYSKEHPATRR